MGIIRITDLNVRAIIGTHPWERINQQDLIINMAIEYDTAKAGKSDALKDALNYEAVAAQVVKTIKRSRFLLLEKLTAKVLAVLMADQRVEAGFIRIDKPHAIPQARCVSFELSSRR